MQRTVGILVVVLVALTGCKQRQSSDDVETMDTFRVFVTAMCACRDKACADGVQEGLTKWSVDMAKSSPSRRDEKLDEATMKQMSEIGQQYAECMTKALQPPVPAEDPEQTSHLETTKEPAPPPVKLSSPADRPTIAKLVAEARAYTRATEEQLAVHLLKLSYVASDGMLDPAHGALAIELSKAEVKGPDPAAIPDDPARPTGAPIPPPPPARTPSKRTHLVSRCPTGTWSSKAGWTWADRLCWKAPELIPRCSTAEVWSRAKAQGAPANAVAIIELHSDDDGTQSWKFSINDPLRKVEVALEIADTCAPVVEKP